MVARGHVSMRQSKPNTSEVTTIAASSISFSLAAIPQQATGAISGTVSDQTGALVPGVPVTITNKDSGAVIGAFSNDSGAFSVYGLSPGNYAMTATLPGFQTSKANAISVQPGMNIQVKVNLRISMTVVVDIAVSALPGSCLQLLGTVKRDGTTYTRADCFELNAAERNVPPRNPPSPEPEDIVILGVSPVALPLAQVPATNRQVIRIGGMVEAGNLLFHPNPAYPPEARRIGLEGRVVLSATIDTNGNVRSVQAIDSSNPLFNQAPVEAIQNWRFKPTLLNGQPIEMTPTITVNFTIGR
jgi:TonB family protein